MSKKLQNTPYINPRDATPRRPQLNPSISPLQRLSRQVNWFVGFKLHHIDVVEFSDLEETFLSRKSKALIEERNTLTKQLKLSIKEDYEVYKASVKRD